MGKQSIGHLRLVLLRSKRVAREYNLQVSRRIASTQASVFSNFRLALQLHFSFEMGAACFGLMGASPERPCDDVGGLDAPLGEPDGDAADFLDRPADQERCFVAKTWQSFF